MLELIVKPREVITWEEFCRNTPAYSIALDGYVYGSPFIQEKQEAGPRANFNHHEEVENIATRSTAGQIFMAIKQGFFEAFRLNGLPSVKVYVNDCDQDVCLAIWLLNNYERIKGAKSDILINALLDVNDKIDSTGGVYPFDPDTKLLRKMSWIFQPYTDHRMSGKLHGFDSNQMLNVIDSVNLRISDYTLGKARELEPDTRYEVLGGGKIWTMIKEVGFISRLKAVNDGINAFVSVVNQREDGNHTYVYGRKRFSPFYLPGIYDHLNEAEGIPLFNPNNKESLDRHGGGKTIGGSPRAKGSIFNPKEMESQVNHYLDLVA